MAKDEYYTSVSSGEPMRGMSTERVLELLNGLKSYDKGSKTLVSLYANPEEKGIKGLPRAPEQSQTLFGFPVRFVDWMPEGYGLGHSPCGCTATEIVRDGDALTHMAKRHTVVIKFDA